MKKLAMACAISASMLLLAACNGDKDDSKPDPDVVAETASGDISKEEFYQALKEKYGEEVLYDLITTEVLSSNFEIDDKEVDVEIDRFKDELGDQFEMWMMQEGFADEEDLRDILKISMLQEAAITNDIEVSDEEIEDYYNDVKVEKEARHILVEDSDLADDLKKQLDEGADFAELAKENSTDSSAEEGGDIGYFSKDSNLVPEFLEAAYALKVDEISEPIESQFGYHIIQVTDSREKEDFASLEDMKNEITRSLKSEKVDQSTAQEKIQKILDDAKIDIKIKEFEDLFEQPAAQG